MHRIGLCLFKVHNVHFEVKMFIALCYTCSMSYNSRVANSHAYGVILTHLTCYSRTHAIDKFTHAFKRTHTHTHAIL